MFEEETTISDCDLESDSKKQDQFLSVGFFLNPNSTIDIHIKNFIITANKRYLQLPMNKGQFCLSMGKSDKSIWQLALIVSLKIERKRGKKSYYFFHVFICTLLCQAYWVLPAHTHVHGSLGMSLVGISAQKTFLWEDYFLLCSFWESIFIISIY